MGHHYPAERFIHRYGLYHGIFLVGMVCAVVHFYSDLSFLHFAYSAVFRTLGLPIFIVEVSVLAIMGEKVRIGIEAPRSVPVFRKEVYVEIQQQRGDDANAASPSRAG